MLRRLAAVLLPAVLLPVTALPASAAPAPVRAQVITEVQPTGFRVVAVALEYSEPVDLGSAASAAAAYTVQSTLRGVTSPRTVLNAYSNDVAEDDGAPSPGRFVILDLHDTEAGAAAVYQEGGLNRAHDLVGAYSVAQTADVRDATGGVLVPSSPTPVANSTVRNRIVDDFSSHAFSDSRGTPLDYRLFSPSGYREDPSTRERYPLVVFLHGGGARGTDNVAQLVSNQGAVSFAAPDMQAAHPTFVVAAQVPPTSAWTDPVTQNAMLELLDQLLEDLPVDRDRVYLTGMSLGGMGTFDILTHRPYTFAAALPVAAAGNPARMPGIRHVPVWATHSIDDAVVRYGPPSGSLALIDALAAAGAEVTRGEWAGNLPDAEAEAQARVLLAEARRNGSHTLLTTFAAGTTPVNPHFSWVPTYTTDTMLHWLFSNVRTSYTSVPDRIGDLLEQGRISERAADAVLERLARAEAAASAGSERRAMSHLAQAIARAENQIKGDAGDLAVRSLVVGWLQVLLDEQTRTEDDEQLVT